MRSLASRWGPVVTRAVGWLLIIAWLALLGWWIYTVYISEIITWILLTLIGWRLRPLACRLWWRYGWHWPLPPGPPPSPPPPFRICCGRDYRGWVSAQPQIAVLVTSTRRDVLDATAAWRAQMGTVWVFDPLGVVGPLPPGARRLVWSPLRGCRDWDTARRRHRPGPRCSRPAPPSSSLAALRGLQTQGRMRAGSVPERIPRAAGRG